MQMYKGFQHLKKYKIATVSNAWGCIYRHEKIRIITRYLNDILIQYSWLFFYKYD